MRDGMRPKVRNEGENDEIREESDSVLRHFAAFRLRPLSPQLSTDPLGPFLVHVYPYGFRFHGFR
jgi:hypothetical protein